MARNAHHPSGARRALEERVVFIVYVHSAFSERSTLLKATRFGNLRRSTLSWCRRTRISASNAARDRNSPIKAHQISLQMSLISRDFPDEPQTGVDFCAFAAF
jgi:hypothetical protein